MNDDVGDAQMPSDQSADRNVADPSNITPERGLAAAGNAPSTYEVMRVLEDAERDLTVRLFMFPNGVSCACGETSCAGSG
jgi:hypothetical protein